jgi:hypothetical protein
MPVTNYLASLTSRVSETQAVYHIVKPHLQNLEKVFAGEPWSLLSLGKMLAKLPF